MYQTELFESHVGGMPSIETVIVVIVIFTAILIILIRRVNSESDDVLKE